MMMNGVLIDEYSSEYKSRMKNITLFPSPVMLDTVEEIFTEFVDDNDQAFSEVKSPFYVLDRIQDALIALQNMLFSESTKLDMDKKTLCTVIVTNHKEAVSMKEKMELSIAMQEMADSKISKTLHHDIANRMIDSMLSGLCNATFGNIAKKTQLAEISQTYKTSRDAGDTIDLDNFLSEFVSVFKHDEQEDEPTLRAAMLATADYPEQPFRDVRGTSGAGGAPRAASFGNGKCRFTEEGTWSTHMESKVLEKFLKAINDLKSDIGFIKKHFMGQDHMKENSTPAPKQFGQRGPANNPRKTGFAGVACQRTTYEPRSLVNRPLTSIDAFESDGESAFVAMAVQPEQMPTAKYNYRIMTAQNNINALGDYCNRYDKIHESNGREYGKPSIKSMRISEPIQETDSPQSSMTIDSLLHHDYPGLQVDGILMMTSIGGQQEMVIDNDGPEINDNDKPVIEPNMKENKACKDKAEIAAITATKMDWLA
jgi:hypothetical protein